MISIQISLSWTTELWLPDYVQLQERPRDGKTASIKQILSLELKANETRTFRVRLDVAKTLSDVLAPTYCPGPPTAYFVGCNNGYVWDEDTKRYLEGTKYADVYHPEAAPNMSAAGVGRYGVWKDALDASHLVNNCPGVEGCPGEYNPDIELLDPSLDAEAGVGITLSTPVEDQKHRRPRTTVRWWIS